MKIKLPLILAIGLFVSGVISVAAQSNPSSSGAVDIEMPLSRPDGTIYVSAAHDASSYTSFNAHPPGPFVEDLDWEEKSGGAGYEIWAPLGGPMYTNSTQWAGGQWPELGNGVVTDFPSGATNFTGPPAITFDYPPYGALHLGGYTFTADSLDDYVSEKDTYTLITGGSPASDGNELYEFSATAVEYDFVDLPSKDWVSSLISDNQIQIGTFGNLGTDGHLWALLPLNASIPVTMQVSGSKYYNLSETVQGYQLVSQCVATTPANRARTTIGVGEQVNLGFNPTLPTNATWSATGGSLSVTTGPSTQFTAPSNAANVTITATVMGYPVNTAFNVIEPNGIATAQIYGTNHYPVGELAAGMIERVTIYPTNVSFARVTIVELSCYPGDLTGFFTNSLVLPTQVGSAQLNSANQYNDIVEIVVGDVLPPIYPGSSVVNVPAIWQVTGSALTNNLGNYSTPLNLLDAAGDCSASRFGITITRSTNDISFSNQ